MRYEGTVQEREGAGSVREKGGREGGREGGSERAGKTEGGGGVLKMVKKKTRKCTFRNCPLRTAGLYEIE